MDVKTTQHAFWTDGREQLRRAMLVKQAEIDYVVAQMKRTPDHGTRRRLEARLVRLLMDLRPSEHSIARSLDMAS